MGIGETAALSAAIMWTISSFLWGRIELKALHLNICKNLVGCGLVIGHIGVLLLFAATWHTNPMDTGGSQTAETSQSVSVENLEASSQSQNEPFRLVADWEAWGWLAISGLVGIVIGDTFYFRSLQILGPRRSLVVATTSPLFATFAGWLMLSEVLAGWQLLGIVLTVIGVMVVVAEKQGKKEALDLFPGLQSTGIMMGIAAAFCQGVGGTISKVGMEHNDCSAAEASMIRLVAAAAGSIIILLVRREGREFAAKFFKRSLIKKVLPASIIGTWIGIWLSQIAFKHTAAAGIAQTLLSTSPLFAIPIVYFVQGHKISAIAIGATILAIYGIMLTVQ
jgi:drug/metabolite transporter (DMT)-like permease